MLKPNPLPGTRHKQWMIDVFQAADKAGSGFVERHELLLLLSACNKTMRPEWIEARMRLIGEEGTSRLSFSQVARLLEAALVDNPALTELFTRYAVAHKTYRPPGGGRAPPFLTLEEFINFGVEVQGEVRGPEWERLAAMQFEAARTGANPQSLSLQEATSSPSLGGVRPSASGGATSSPPQRFAALEIPSMSTQPAIADSRSF